MSRKSQFSVMKGGNILRVYREEESGIYKRHWSFEVQNADGQCLYQFPIDDKRAEALSRLLAPSKNEGV